MNWIEEGKKLKILNPPGQFYLRSKEIFSKQNQLNTRKIRILYSVVFFMHKMSWPEISLCLSLSYWARGKWIAISRGKWHAKSHLAIEQGGGRRAMSRGKWHAKSRLAIQQGEKWLDENTLFVKQCAWKKYINKKIEILRMLIILHNRPHASNST